jgi:hypothetical protein
LKREKGKIGVKKPKAMSCKCLKYEMNSHSFLGFEKDEKN